eukprot:3249603-Amphidinium_carterae.1
MQQDTLNTGVTWVRDAVNAWLVPGAEAREQSEVDDPFAAEVQWLGTQKPYSVWISSRPLVNRDVTPVPCVDFRCLVLICVTGFIRVNPFGGCICRKNILQRSLIPVILKCQSHQWHKSLFKLSGAIGGSLQWFQWKVFTVLSACLAIGAVLPIARMIEDEYLDVDFCDETAADVAKEEHHGAEPPLAVDGVAPQKGCKGCFMGIHCQGFLSVRLQLIAETLNVG